MISRVLIGIFVGVQALGVALMLGSQNDNWLLFLLGTFLLLPGSMVGWLGAGFLDGLGVAQSMPQLWESAPIWMSLVAVASNTACVLLLRLLATRFGRARTR